MLIDIHAHMDMLKKSELKKVLEKARGKNIEKIISCSTSFESNKKNLELAKKYDQIEVAIGLYPLNAIELNENEIKKAFDFFEENIKYAKAIGEVGLDFKYSKKEEEKEKQKNIFKKFIKLSNETKKPLIIHSRYAQREVIETLSEEKAKYVILHGFTESLKLMDFAYKKKWFIGVGLNVIENNHVRENLREFFLSNIFAETDSPIKFNGKKASPNLISRVAEELSEIKGIATLEVENQIEENYKKLF